MNRARVAAVPLSARAAATGATLLVAAAALALRLSGLGGVAPDPFYDAAVRSMGTSWHDFLFGALEPGGSVAIDKPAVALWPQVAATKLLGFSTLTLLLPVGARGPGGRRARAAAGERALGRLRRLGGGGRAGRRAARGADRPQRHDGLPRGRLGPARGGRAGGGRARGSERRRGLGRRGAGRRGGGRRGAGGDGAAARGGDVAGRWLLAGAGAAVGAAFAVKLAQALIPVPALAVLYVAASPLSLGERLSRLALCGAVALAVGLAWFAVVSTAPGREQPWAYGSHDGTALSAAFAYDGLDRLAGPERPAARAR